MDEGASASVSKGGTAAKEVKLRNVNGGATKGSVKLANNVQVKLVVNDEEAKGVPVKHYDADGMRIPLVSLVLRTITDFSCLNSTNEGYRIRWYCDPCY